jgi:hypothetical protein
LLQQAPKAAITHSVAELAARLLGNASHTDEEEVESKSKKGWLPFLKK